MATDTDLNTQERETLRHVFARNVNAHRTQRRWTQQDLANLSGLDRTFIGHVELGRRNLSIDNIEKMATALGVPAWKLLKP